MLSTPKYIDLFAGCGGLSTGFHLAGWQGLFAVEKSPMAFSTLRANLIDKRRHFAWPEWLDATNWDIKQVLAQKTHELMALKGTVDLIVGGPPCQGFSTAGRRHEGDERNDLVHSYLQFVKIVEPKAVFFENVRGFDLKFKAKAEAGATYSQLVIRRLRELGYKDAVGRLINMSRYGLPQRRKRFILIATRDGVAKEVFKALREGVAHFLSSRGIPRRNGARAAISDLHRSSGLKDCPDSRGFKSGVASRPRTGLQWHLRVDGTSYTPDSHRFVNHSQEVEGVFSRLLDKAPRNRCILGDERTPYGLRKRSVIVLSPTAIAPTVTSLPDDFVHYHEPRIMTVRECARLQTFPDWFEFKGKYTTGGKERSSTTPK